MHFMYRVHRYIQKSLKEIEILYICLKNNRHQNENNIQQKFLI